jgi:hypothetical protein
MAKDTTTVTVTLDDDSEEVTVQVDGHKGRTCTDLTRNLLRALGEVTTVTKTKEYHAKPIDAHNSQRMGR